MGQQTGRSEVENGRAGRTEASRDTEGSSKEGMDRTGWGGDWERAWGRRIGMAGYRRGSAGGALDYLRRLTSQYTR